MLAADPARTLTIQLTYDDSAGQPGWFGRVVEKPGCMSEGDTIDEALAMIAGATRAPALRSCARAGVRAWDDSAGEQ